MTEHPTVEETPPLDILTIQNIEGLRRTYERLHDEADGRLGSKSMQAMAAARAEYQAALQKHGLELISTALSAIRDRAPSQGGVETNWGPKKALTAHNRAELRRFVHLVAERAIYRTAHNGPDDLCGLIADGVLAEWEQRTNAYLQAMEGVASPPVPADLEAVEKLVEMARGCADDFNHEGYGKIFDDLADALAKAQPVMGNPITEQNQSDVVSTLTAERDTLAEENKRWSRLEQLAVSGTAETFLSLPDEQKRQFFAFAVDDSSRRKVAEAERDAALAGAGRMREALASAWDAGFRFGCPAPDPSDSESWSPLAKRRATDIAALTHEADHAG